MSRLIESIKLLEGRFYNLSFHEERMMRALHHLYGISARIDLEHILGNMAFPQSGWHKCRIVYDRVSRAVSFTPYESRRIESLKIVQDEKIMYNHKFEDRSAIDRLFAQRNGCDDILISKEGRVTDCSFSNIVFKKGATWFTPKEPLLRGTARRRLIAEKIVQPREIRIADIRSFDTFKIINAMLEFDSPEIEVSAIVF